MTVTIGPLHPHHRSRLEGIVRAAGVFTDAEVDVALELFDEAVGTPDAPDPAGTADTRRPEATGYEFVGAFHGDTLVGYACFGATPSTDRTYDLYWIAVHPDAQRSGAGTTLMDEVERRLSGRRARMLVVETSSRDDYAPTRRFYSARGYADAVRVRDFYAPGDDRLVLVKRVTPPDAADASRMSLSPAGPPP